MHTGAGPQDLPCGCQTAQETTEQIGFGPAAIHTTVANPVAAEFDVPRSRRLFSAYDPVGASLMDSCTRSRNGDIGTSDTLDSGAGAAETAPAFDTVEGLDRKAPASPILHF